MRVRVMACGRASDGDLDGDDEVMEDRHGTDAQSPVAPHRPTTPAPLVPIQQHVRAAVEHLAGEIPDKFLAALCERSIPWIVVGQLVQPEHPLVQAESY